MKFDRLRVLGFKSFVEPSDFLIAPGLTGVVGPNGCGKSNLVEALRWVMGESSYKNMRASGMDDVIFSGSLNRPARNTAEVTLFVDNADRTAPAAFNDADVLEVTRRIEREAGSVYRINGKEVRARDVQLLFADASTGARSPAMVGQGRIGELIAAKPQARRAVLEEAAGISGLYSRRNEAETRLKAAEQNLERLEDVLAEIDAQIETLKRQVRQANRYRNLSADIRGVEATVLHLRWRAAARAVAEAESALGAAEKGATGAGEVQARTARDQAVAAAALPPLREAEAAAGATLQRLNLARESLEAEEKRLRDRLGELDRRLRQLGEDVAREEKMAAENAGTLARLDEEEARLVAEDAAAVETTAAAAARRAAAETALAGSEAALTEATAAHARIAAARAGLERAARETADRLARIVAEYAGVEREADALARQIAALPGVEPAEARVADAEAALAAAEAEAAAAERRAAGARDAEAAARPAVTEAERTLGAIETEAKTLARLLAPPAGAARRPPLLDAMTVEKGFEAALVAAFGEELDASDDAAAPVYWRGLAPVAGDPALPQGAAPLAAHVEAPALLARALAQIGVVAAEDGPRLQAALAPGQVLVTRKGAVWRWDGYCARPGAPTAAAQRLENRNRLAELQTAAEAARVKAAEAKAVLDAASASGRAAAEAERTAREAARQRQKALDAARGALADAEREAARLVARRAALDEAKARVAASRTEAEAAKTAAAAALAGAEDPQAAQNNVNALRATVAEGRSALAEARAAVESLARDAEVRRRRRAAIGEERARWQSRAANAATQMATLAARRAEVEAERAGLADGPGEFDVKRRALAAEIARAETGRREAAERRAAAEAALAEADRAARAALAALSETREARARGEERLAAARERRAETEARILDVLDGTPAETAKLAALDPDAPPPDLGQLETRLDRLRQERERLGAVNLRAEDETREAEARRETLVRDRDDLIEAIKRLRQGIASLNREGRERLVAAFQVVDGHFRALFTHLFGGGTAELQLTESDDPLEAGLEILARPPGKKPQTMTLLSGGEQALTAMALIFAVFLTNPAPICVLDEVDAPLDDHNVERFCNLLDEMARRTDTRFVTITHNPITMARMNRLFGVTMAERGVSQLVSVDLETAERFREAG
ncbi:chromosome segregation protein SMC [Prosthecomicrobium pneumaticum]|uniref:Chromosome partition protein Smc n=1 Tax=Prosthecomicrobium pneumaticum TaxID=81895 RepID=A0A7W9CUM1_9HYPH|nr:chromosome segregation protein SMC [Prosthecomicrobium pneumaticum]MBB5751984.1 chromosome segregation protein [Prosthecomicrobium pneumaticum]